MKRTIICFLLISLLLCACHTAHQPKSDVLVEGAPHVTGNTQRFALNIEDAAFLQNVLNSEEWKPFITKSVWEYVIYLPDRTLYYTVSDGLFNDKENDVHIIVSEEVKAEINQMLASVVG